MALEPGTNLGPYRIVEQAGAGGMATVYKAYQASLSRFVAIKVLPAYFSQDSEFGQRFQREAINVARLRHPNILTVFDYGSDNGVSYIVTEFVDGGTLADQLGNPLPVDYAVQMLKPVASALDYAHALGIVHRDIKPSNILLWRNGTPTLSDFGLAKMMDAQPGLTSTAVSMGTPEYMAPEQGAGQDAGPASDLYALAVIVYQMLTGRVPFRAETPLAVLLAHLQNPLPMPRTVNPAISGEVEAVLLKALAKAPADRYRSAIELINALEAARPAAADAGDYQRLVEANATQRMTTAPQADAPTMVAGIGAGVPQLSGDETLVVPRSSGAPAYDPPPMAAPYEAPRYDPYTGAAYEPVDPPPGNPAGYFMVVLKKYAVFRGRARRAEFWMFALINFIISAAVQMFDVGIEAGGILQSLYGVATLVPYLALSTRRLHDTNHSGWWQLIALTIIGLIPLFIWAIKDSDPGPNRYGLNPKGGPAG